MYIHLQTQVDDDLINRINKTLKIQNLQSSL
jgi:hypothetical protein